MYSSGEDLSSHMGGAKPARPANARSAVGLPSRICANTITLAPATPAPPTRIRGTIASLAGQTLTVNSRDGQKLEVTLADNVTVVTVKKVELASIAAGSYIGTATRTGADGKLNALEVLVFPEAARGSGEGHSPWDLQPGSTMTNATVAELAASPQGRRLTLRYKDGEKTVVVPENVPIVTFKPGDKSLIVPGANVIVFAQVREGKPTALRALAGRGSFAPPM